MHWEEWIVSKEVYEAGLEADSKNQFREWFIENYTNGICIVYGYGLYNWLFYTEETEQGNKYIIRIDIGNSCE